LSGFTIFSTIEHATWCRPIRNITLPVIGTSSIGPSACSTALKIALVTLNR